MRQLDPKYRESFEYLQELIDRIKPEWLKESNIIDLRPVLKTRGGAVQPETLVIGFYVQDKIPRELLDDRGYREIPADIEGVGTDVIPVRQRPLGSVDEKDTRSAMFDTLVGGCAVGNKEMGVYGTFGMPLLAVSDGRMVGLTNEHVLVFDIDGHAGDEVWQPRFHLNAEVSLDSADCCPDGQLHFRGVDNPIVDASAAVFTACVIAAFSDVIDPHRRGQVATLPEPDERTQKETVSAELRYPEIPFPGRPYKIGVKWNYARQTNARVLNHAVSETQVNDHVLTGQLLTTDQPKYPPGARVVLTALLGPETDKSRCGNYFVTAAALSPSHKKAYKIILRPIDVTNVATWSASGDTQVVHRCYGFPRDYLGKLLRQPTVLNGITYDPHGRTMEVVIEGGVLGLRFPPAGISAMLPFPVQEVSARVQTGSAAVTLKAFNGTIEVASTTAAPAAAPVVLNVTAANITSLEFSGGKVGVILEICVTRRVRRLCAYRGMIQLAHDEEIGEWMTYLFAQTRNDVALGIAPTIAAQTIGGLPVTDNFVDAGETDSFIYGHRCNVELKPDGSFEVVAPG
jgi:hypothetical protein